NQNYKMLNLVSSFCDHFCSFSIYNSKSAFFTYFLNLIKVVALKILHIILNFKSSIKNRYVLIQHFVILIGSNICSFSIYNSKSAFYTYFLNLIKVVALLILHIILNFKRPISSI